SGSSIPFQRSRVEPLRPACASCRAIRAGLAACTNSTMRFQATTCSGLYMPVQPGVIRPSRLTSVISATTRAAPPTAREPRFTRCQSPGVPSWAEYWHIGETTMRFENSVSRSRNGGEHRRRRRGRGDGDLRLLLGARDVPSVDRGHEARVASLQILVRHAEASRQEAHRELDRLETGVVALGLFEPLEAHLGRALETLDLGPPVLL